MKSNVVFFIQSSGRYESRRLKGFYSFALERGWQVCVIDRRQQMTALAKLIRFWKPIGCVIEGLVAVENSALRLLCGIPIVLCDENPQRLECGAWSKCAAFIKHDSVATAERASTILTRSGRRSYAFAGTVEQTDWSVERLRAFENSVKGTASYFDSFTVDRKGPFLDAIDYQRKLKAWIQRLPKPCAILAANDFIGTLVIAACRDMRISIPEQVSLMGVDNDELCCENQRPTLSSVEPDFEKAGYLAGELLGQLIAGKVSAGCCREFGPARVVERQTSVIVNKTSRSVLKALEKIRLEACRGLKAVDVLATLGGARSKAERLFREATGASVLEKIEERRLEEACVLLSRKGVKIDTIANFCGYKSSSFLRKRFREKFGVSMTEWRERSKALKGIAKK